MILKEALHRAREMLAINNLEDAPLEAELLLRHVKKTDRVQLYLILDQELSFQKYEEFSKLVERRLDGEPIAYIVGHREFYGLDFLVNSDVLIPRPESELLVERTIQLAQKHTLNTIAEIGTGCGAIAISLAINLPQAKIYATDISEAALKVACFNSRKHGVNDRLSFLKGDMLDPLPEPVDLIIANLPYVKESELAQTQALHFEPSVALNGGPDGLEKIYRLSIQTGAKLNLDGNLLLEVGNGQGKVVTDFLCRLFPKATVEMMKDLSDTTRVVNLTLSSSKDIKESDQGHPEEHIDEQSILPATSN